jgi:SAM-dependent methyltransferase
MSSEVFLAEYSSENAVRKYTRKTAGDGINYLLEHEYGEIYLKTIREHMSAPIGSGIRLLEFGCGGGMNLLHCMSVLEREKIPLAAAFGTDFSKRLIMEARKEAGVVTQQPEERVKFSVARSECLLSDMTSSLQIAPRELLGSFQLIVGVNTFRYCCRLGKGQDCAKEIYDLLMPGGVCVMIDMNRKFPMFRTLVRDRLTRPKSERYLPSLEEYAAPFASVGLQVLEKKNFCWIPHSAGPVLLGICRALTPALDAVFPRYAMRSLVISKKPA